MTLARGVETKQSRRLRSVANPEPPHSEAAEQSLLGALMLGTNAWALVVDLVSAEDFYRSDHRQIFRAIGSLAKAAQACDPVTVAAELARSGDLEASGGLAYLGEITNDTPSAENVRAYAEIVREKAAQRRLLNIGPEIARAITNNASSLQTVSALLPPLERLRDRLQPQAAQRQRRAPVAWSELEGRDPPPRQWIVPHWIPDKHTTLLAGRGGIGKTLLAQHIATALALAHEYMEPLESRAVLMWAGEDDLAELWRRQKNISSYMGRPLSDLSERFYLHSYAGEDITLAAPIYGSLAPTPLLEELREQVGDYRAQLVVLDNVARIYGGSENDRHAVTTFLAWLAGACAPAAILLLSHPAKAPDSEYSGNTAWEASVRARLYLSDRPLDQAEDEDAPRDPHVRYLARRKANYSPLEIRRLRMADGVLIPAPIETARLGTPTGEYVEDIVRRAARALAQRGMFGTASTASPNYLPKLAKQFGLLENATDRAFTDAMRKMIISGELRTVQVGKNSNRTPKIGLVLDGDHAHK